MRNLIITGGIFHDFQAGSLSLARVLDEVGIHSEIVSDFDDALRRLQSYPYALLTIYALRWRMLDHEKYEPFRAEWALNLSESGRAILASHVRGGAGLLGLHTASICFDDWPEWRAVLGAAWVWQTSFHPPPRELAVRPARANHVLVRGVPTFRLRDELYQQIGFEPAVTPLLEASLTDSSSSHLVAWAHSYGRGRVVGDLLGHDAASIEQADHRSFLQRAALWAAGSLCLPA